MIVAYPQRGYEEHAVHTIPVNEAHRAPTAPIFISDEQRYFFSSQFVHCGHDIHDQPISKIDVIPMRNTASRNARSSLVGVLFIRTPSSWDFHRSPPGKNPQHGQETGPFVCPNRLVALP
jgi:hypothetical protein